MAHTKLASHKPMPRSLDTAVCACGHYLVDHRVALINYQTGKITMAECLSSMCGCSTYIPEGRS